MNILKKAKPIQVTNAEYRQWLAGVVQQLEDAWVYSQSVRLGGNGERETDDLEEITVSRMNGLIHMCLGMAHGCAYRILHDEHDYYGDSEEG